MSLTEMLNCFQGIFPTVSQHEYFFNSTTMNAVSTVCRSTFATLSFIKLLIELHYMLIIVCFICLFICLFFCMSYLIWRPVCASVFFLFHVLSASILSIDSFSCCCWLNILMIFFLTLTITSNLCTISSFCSQQIKSKCSVCITVQHCYTNNCIYFFLCTAVLTFPSKPLPIVEMWL